MTDEEIRKLARSAAEEMYKGYKEKNIALMEEEFKMLISFILKEHCIVEKEKVKQLYDKIDSSSNDGDTEYAAFVALRDMTEIFGKEMFEENKK